MYPRFVLVPALALCSACLYAQAPQQQIPYPIPPNAAPPRGEVGGTRDAKDSKGKKRKKNQQELPTITAEGLTQSYDGKRLIVNVPDGRTLLLDIAPDTTWQRNGAAIDPSKLVPLTTVRVTAAVEDNYDLTLRSAELLKDAPVASPAVAALAHAHTDQGQDDDTLLTSSKVLSGPEDPDRPILKRNKTNKAGVAHVTTDTSSAKTENASAKKSDDLDFTIDSDTTLAPPKHSAGLELLNRTTDWTQNYISTLPNYYCRQNTTRYERQNKDDDWHAQDVVSADVVYEDGNESYRNIMLDGKKTDKDMMHLGGQSSTGEFGSLLATLFDPVRNTDFTYQRTASMGDRQVAIYSFKVALPNSAWAIYMGGQILHPAYSGRVWVDKKTGEVRRLEQQADNIPKDFPESLVETAVDYDYVYLGTSEYLVPVQSENIGCQRDTSMCARNVIEFRDYHRYKGESTLIF